MVFIYSAKSVSIKADAYKLAVDCRAFNEVNRIFVVVKSHLHIRLEIWHEDRRIELEIGAGSVNLDSR